MKTTDASYERVKRREDIHQDNFEPLLVPGLSTNSGSNSSSTSPSLDLSSSSSSTVPERSDGTAPGSWCDISKNNQKKMMIGKNRTTVCEIFGSGWRSSQIIWKTQNCLHPETVLGTQIRKIQRKWNQEQRSTIFSHFPQDRNCEICLRIKMTMASCRKRTGEALPRARKIGDSITADHKVLNEGCESRDNHRHDVVVQDLATQRIQ